MDSLDESMPAFGMYLCTVPSCFRAALVDFCKDAGTVTFVKVEMKPPYPSSALYEAIEIEGLPFLPCWLGSKGRGRNWKRKRSASNTIDGRERRLLFRNFIAAAPQDRRPGGDCAEKQRPENDWRKTGCDSGVKDVYLSES